MSAVLDVPLEVAPTHRCDVCLGTGEQFPTTKCETCGGSGVRARLIASEWSVRPWDKAEAAAFVREHHYSAQCDPRAVHAFGLFRYSDPETLLGAAVWKNGLPRSAAQTFSDDWTRVLSLYRLAIAPEVPTNGASFLIGRAVRAIRREGVWHTLATYADTWQGHTGAIYRATNWTYLGVTKPTAVWVRDGSLVADRAGGNVAGKGKTSVQMRADGARLIGRFRKHKFRMVLR